MSIIWSKYMACNSQMCWHCGGRDVPLCQKPERWTVEAPSLVSAESSGASSVTEWVLERQAEKCWVTAKVNKIKAGNLRASVLHKRCRQQQGGGSVKDKGGWEDYRECVCVWECVQGHTCLYTSGGGILIYFASNTLWQTDEGPLLWACSIYTLLSKLDLKLQQQRPHLRNDTQWWVSPSRLWAHDCPRLTYNHQKTRSVTICW